MCSTVTWESSQPVWTGRADCGKRYSDALAQALATASVVFVSHVGCGHTHYVQHNPLADA